MMDKSHELSIARQARELNLSRGSIYYKARPVSAADLVLMRRMDAPHLLHASRRSWQFVNTEWENSAYRGMTNSV